MTEVCYMTGTRLGAEAEAGFLDALRNKEFHLEAITDQDLTRMADLVLTFAKQKLGSADASVVAAAERLGTHHVATLNHKGFRQIVPLTKLAYELLPPEHLLARHRR
jgi:predicted nucleic acid-binding protein